MPIGKGAIVAICVLALVLVATAAPAQEMALDIKRIEDRGQLVVAMYHRDTERVNDFATPGDVNLVCGRRVYWWVFSPQVAG
jgi:hypothetical protein